LRGKSAPDDGGNENDHKNDLGNENDDGND
jgi:hypothetical protein